MQTRPLVIGALTAACVLLLTILIVFAAGAYSSPGMGATHIRYRPGNFVGLSTTQIADRALQLLRGQQMDLTGEAQVLLVRPVTREDVVALGLNCIPDSPTIEQPPLVLVIYHGDFAISHLPGTNNIKDGGVHYLAYIFDVWAGEVTAWETSANGGRFRLALNDPSLPAEQMGSRITCPSFQGTKTMHYGDTLPPPPRTPAPFATTPPPPSPPPTILPPPVVTGEPATITAP
jgi:hypothetical protein